jgi:hypothetical protein
MQKLIEMLSAEQKELLQNIAKVDDNNVKFLLECIVLMEQKLSVQENETKKWNAAWHEQRVKTGEYYWEVRKLTLG